MVYVDLNPIRANKAEKPEESEYTSIKERIAPQFDLSVAIQTHLDPDIKPANDMPVKPLALFLDQEPGRADITTTTLPYAFEDYLQLVDVTGRIVRQDKRGAIGLGQFPILRRLQISSSTWVAYSTQFERLHRRGEFRLRAVA